VHGDDRDLRQRVTAPDGDGAPARAFAAVFERVAQLRGGARALHTVGTTYDARLQVDPRSLVGAALGRPFERPAVVRMSRSIGLPPSWPDVLGVAVRTSTGPGTSLDVLLASVGRPGAGRVLPTRACGTLLPYRVDGRLLHLGLVPGPEGDRLALTERSPTGRRRVIGALVLRSPRPEDPVLAFDPLLHSLPRLRPVGLLSRVRELAYTGSRRGRGVDGATPTGGCRAPGTPDCGSSGPAGRRRL
jgi:hypothetical protein